MLVVYLIMLPFSTTASDPFLEQIISWTSVQGKEALTIKPPECAVIDRDDLNDFNENNCNGHDHNHYTVPDIGLEETKEVRNISFVRRDPQGALEDDQGTWSLYRNIPGCFVFENKDIELMIVSLAGTTLCYGRKQNTTEIYQADIIDIEILNAKYKRQFLIPKIRLKKKLIIPFRLENENIFNKFALVTMRDDRLENHIESRRKEVTGMLDSMRTHIMTNGKITSSFITFL